MLKQTPSTQSKRTPQLSCIGQGLKLQLCLLSDVSKNTQIGSIGLLGRKEVRDTVVTQLVLMWHIYLRSRDGEMLVQERTMFTSEGTSGSLSISGSFHSMCGTSLNAQAYYRFCEGRKNNVRIRRQQFCFSSL